MIDIRIAFFDIDGTLLPIGEKNGFSPLLTRALQKLQQQGVALFAASGRPPFFIPCPDGIVWDGMMCFNGSYCLDHGKPVFSSPIPRKTVERVIANASQMGLPVNIETAACMGANFDHPLLDAFLGDAKRYMRNDLFESLLDSEIIQLMVPVNAEQEQALFAGVTGLKADRWCEFATDVVPIGSSKAEGMRRILEARGLSREQSIAFGDGGNDRSMIAYSGLGVAMANATDTVKAAADYVTGTCQEDGVVTALQHFKLI